jgi:hypothetical protein
VVSTPEEKPPVTVDDLKVARFVYLLLSNENLRDVIDTITSKVVLILGRYSEDRKPILDAISDELRERNLQRPSQSADHPCPSILRFGLG